jgi:hypothetical protein
MASTSAAPAPDRAHAWTTLTADLRRIFGVRLRTVAAYALQSAAPGGPLHSLALVDALDFQDFAACAPLADAWGRAGLAVPLILTTDEFTRTLDVFPLEYGAILDDYRVIDGDDLLAGLAVTEADLRRACEHQAKSLVIHLREGFLESGREPRAVAALIGASAPAFRAVLVNIARLDGAAPPSPDDEALASAASRTIGIARETILDVLRFAHASTPAIDPAALLARYMEAAGRVWLYVDRWRRP